MTRDADTILLPERYALADFLKANDIHPYGANPYGYLWVSWSGKFGNAVLTTDELYKLFKNDPIYRHRNV